MFMFIDGQPVILTFEQVEQLYYQAFIAEFGEISITQWRGSYEYKTLYPAIQLMVENGTITQEAIDAALNTIQELNEEIKRPAVLHSRVAERFAEEGYIATIRVADLANKGIVAICVDYTPDAEQNTEIANLIVNEMLPAGQHMEGAITQAVVISNGQSVLAQWESPTLNDIDFKITLTVDKNSPYPVDTVDEIVSKFLTNFNSMNQLGQDITPATYYQIERDAPWASSIVTEYDLNASGTYTTDIYYAAYTDKFIATLDPVNVIIITV